MGEKHPLACDFPVKNGRKSHYRPIQIFALRCVRTNIHVVFHGDEFLNPAGIENPWQGQERRRYNGSKCPLWSWKAWH